MIETKSKTKSGKLPFYISPLTDFGFKKLFCSDPRGAERLLAILKAFVPDKMKDVRSIVFRPTEMLGEKQGSKRVTYDIYGVTDSNTHVIIEMQRGQQTYFNNRIITYSCRLISNEAVRGDYDYVIPGTITFCIMDFSFRQFSDSGEFFHFAQLKDERNRPYSDKILFCFLELGKFKVGECGQLSEMRFESDMHKWG